MAMEKHHGYLVYIIRKQSRITIVASGLGDTKTTRSPAACFQSNCFLLLVMPYRKAVVFSPMVLLLLLQLLMQLLFVVVVTVGVLLQGLLREAIGANNNMGRTAHTTKNRFYFLNRTHF